MQKNTIPIRVLLKDITFTYDNLLDNETRLFDYDLQNDPNPISENCVAWII